MARISLLDRLSLSKSRWLVFGSLAVLALITFWVANSITIKKRDLATAYQAQVIAQNMQWLRPGLLQQSPQLWTRHSRQLEKAMQVLANGGPVNYGSQEVQVPAVSGRLEKQLAIVQQQWQAYRGVVGPAAGQDSAQAAQGVVLLLNINAAQLDLKALQAAYGQLFDAAQSLQTGAQDRLRAVKQQEMVAYIVLLSIILSFLALMQYFIKSQILTPTLKLAKQSQKLAQGDFSYQVQVKTKNELGSLSTNINNLGQSLQHATQFTQEIGKGNLEASYQGLEEGSQVEHSLAGSLLKMRNEMKKNAEADRQRSWTSEGLTQFVDILRKHQESMTDLGVEIITELVHYIDCVQGAFFIVKKENETAADHLDADSKASDDELILDMIASYAYDRRKFISKQLKPGEGLVGQCYLEGDVIHLVEIPEEYTEIASGLGEAAPKSLLLVPLKNNDEILGIVELASFNRFPDYHIDFVKEVGENIASTISSVLINSRTRALLEDSQELTQQLKSQEEEMMQNMEEMQATQEEMRRSQKRLQSQQANMNALINSTSDSIITIDTDFKLLVINQVVKDRYKGSQYEGIDVGVNVLDYLGSVANEWKGYYQRAFKGERLDFVLKSTVNKEDSYRQYYINPIEDEDGAVTGCSVISRDVTRETVTQQQNTALVREMNQKQKLIETAFAFVELDINKRFTRINKVFLEKVGLGRGQVMSKHINTLLANESYLNEGLDSMEKGKVWQEYVAFKNAEGGQVPMHSVSTALTDEKGKVKRYYLIFWDDTGNADSGEARDE